MEAKKRVILINGDDTKWYEQAIFIVKKDVDGAMVPVDFVSEAEKIINDYMKTKNIPNPYAAYQKQISKQPKKMRKTVNGAVDFILNGAMLLSCVLLAAVLYNFFK